MHIETSLIGIIWRTMNGSAATDKVSWLERPSILSWISSLPAKHFPTAVQNTLWLNKAWGDTAGPPGAGCTLKHHSLELNPFGGHGMIQQQMIRCLGWKGLQFLLGLAPCLCQTFPDTAGRPLGAGCTLKHHSLDLYRGHVMVQQQMIWCLGL